MTTTLTFTDDELATLDRALGDLPYREAAPLVASINRQITEEADRAAAELEDQRNRNRDESNALPPVENGEWIVLSNGRRVAPVPGGYVAADDGGWLTGVRESPDAWLADPSGFEA